MAMRDAEHPKDEAWTDGEQDVQANDRDEKQGMRFMADSGLQHENGRLWVEEGIVHFEGNLAECGVIFVEHVLRVAFLPASLYSGLR
jgi:hypothetical protein